MRICVTGLGIVSPLGTSVEEHWAGIVAGTCGIGPIEQFATGWLSARVAGEVKGFDPVARLGADAAGTTRSDQFALVAAREAVAGAGLDLAAIDPLRVGLSVGTCQGSVGELAREEQGRAKTFLASSADEVARRLGVAGPRVVASNACAAGAASVAVATELLLAGDVDVMLAGGTDGLTFFTLAGFSTLQSLDPEACSPYGRSSGLTVGEGAAMLVLERVDDAEARGATPLADLLGYGLSADAYHPTAPDPTGRGAALAVQRALAAAGLDPEDVSYVNGHGTGTEANDEMERKAFRLVFGDAAPRVPISSTKSMIGHLLGAAGTAEAVTCILAIDRGVLPPTVNMPEGEGDAGFDFVPNRSRPTPVDVAVSTSYAFGGANAALALGRPGRRPAAPVGGARPEREEVVVTGVGAVGGLGIGFDAWVDAFKSSRSAIGAITGFDATPYGSPLAVETPRLKPQLVASGTAYRKMDAFTRLCVASGRQAWETSGLQPTAQQREGVGVVLATATGSLDVITEFDHAARHDPAGASARLFPHTSMNSAAGHLATLLGVRGPTLSITTGGVSALAALAYASQLVEREVCEVVLVMSGDLFCEATLAATHGSGFLPLTSTAVRPFDRHADGTALGSAAVTLVLEGRRRAEARGATVLGRIRATATLGGTDATPTAATWTDVVRAAVTRAQADPAAVGYAAAAAGGLASDGAELEGISAAVGTHVRVGAPKSLAGETLGTAGLVNVLAALAAVGAPQVLPATANLTHPVGDPARHVLVPEVSATGLALATAVSPGSGVAATLVGAP